ncbi:MAG: type II secretion system protein GspM [Mariprofundales bacterium]|nr:type II secretion system protein GspM [Mariprofundales bacterium]
MRELLLPLWEPLQGLWYRAVLPRYYELQPREQRLVVGAALLIPATLLLFGLLLPAEDSRHAEEVRLAALQQQLVRAEQLADQLTKAVKVEPPDNMLEAVERLARLHDVRSFMTRIKPQTDLSGQQKLLLQMKSAPFAKVVKFIQGVTARGLIVDQIKLQATKTAAVVNLQMVLTQ